MLCATCKNKGCCGLYSDVEDLKAELISCKKYIYSPVEEVTADAPAVDAVEVVRCEKCMHKGWVSEPCHGKSVDFCKLHDFVVRSDDYCSYGVLKEGE